jgi:hypothetical protein
MAGQRLLFGIADEFVFTIRFLAWNKFLALDVWDKSIVFIVGR